MKPHTLILYRVHFELCPRAWVDTAACVQGARWTRNEVSDEFDNCQHRCHFVICSRLPSSDFSVQDVKRLVGPRRVVDVMDTRTQEASTMTLSQWAKYYNTKPRQKLLNVISLEFSCTKLDPLVKPPSMVSAVSPTSLLRPSLSFTAFPPLLFQSLFSLFILLYHNSFFPLSLPTPLLAIYSKQTI